MDEQLEKFFGFFILFLFVIVGLSIAPQVIGTATTSSTEEEEEPPLGSLWLHTDGTEIRNSEDEETVWNGVTSKTLFGYGYYGQDPLDCFVNESDVELIRFYGMNSLRVDIQLNVATHLVPYSSQTPTDLTYYTRFWQVLDEVVTACENEGVWCIINYGHTDGVWSPQGVAYWNDGNGLPTWMYNGSWSYFNRAYAMNLTGRDNAIRDFWNLTDTDVDPVRQAYQTFWVDIATRYKDEPHVIYCLFNEPMNQWGGGSTLWTNQTEGAVYYKQFTEETIDLIRAVETTDHLIIVNAAYFWDWTTNLEIEKTNVVWTAHSYEGVNSSLVDLGWRFDQPFFFGEFGGIEESLMTEEDVETDILYCNSQNVGWGYLRYDPTNGYPESTTWTLLEENLISGIRYYGAL